MGARVFVAGATGVVGRRLVPLLLEAGHAVFGMTRRESGGAALAEAGVTPVVLDVFDGPALLDALSEIRPEVVIDQLTDLPDGLDPARMEGALVRNARIRREGTRNLVDAALAAGARRLIAQSLAWAYAPGREPHVEADPLDVEAAGDRSVTVGGVAELERLTLESPPLEGVVLRYGKLYGPGTGFDRPGGEPSLHVDASARAAQLALGAAAPAVFNIAEPGTYVSSEKARRELGWDPGFRVGAS